MITVMSLKFHPVKGNSIDSFWRRLVRRLTRRQMKKPIAPAPHTQKRLTSAIWADERPLLCEVSLARDDMLDSVDAVVDGRVYKVDGLVVETVPVGISITLDGATVVLIDEVVETDTVPD